MDEKTRQRNIRNASRKEESEVISRPSRLFSQRSISAIVNHIGSNPEFRDRCLLKRIESDFTEQLIISKVEKENCGSRIAAMKVEKTSNPYAKVSDSFPKTLPVIRRRKHGIQFTSVKSIPLPGEEFTETTGPPVRRKPVTCTSTSEDNSINNESTSVEQTAQNYVGVFNEEKSTDYRSYIQNDEQCNGSTSSVSNSESLGSNYSLEEHQESFYDIAWQGKESLYKASHVNVTPVTDHQSNTKYHIPTSRMSTYCPTKYTSNETSYSYLNHSISENQYGYYKGGSECKSNEENTDLNQVPVQIINYPNYHAPPPSLGSPNFHASPPTSEGSWCERSEYESNEEGIAFSNLPVQTVIYSNFKTPPPSSAGLWCTATSSRTVCPPVNDSLRNPTNSYAPWKTHSRSRSRNHPIKSFGQDGQRGMTSSNLPRASEGNWRASEGNWRTPQSPQTMESPFFYHLSPDVSDRQAVTQKKYSADYSLGGRDENFGNSTFTSPYYSRTGPPYHSMPPLYLPIQEPDHPLEPNLKGHQLVGDSQLLRFARQVLGKVCRTSDNLRYLGLCVSGQTIQELLQKIKAKFYPVGDRVMLMIGTNNFLQNHCLDDIICAWDELISHLLCVQSRRLLLLTVPPIPKLATHESYWEELDKFNAFIRGYADSSEDLITVADISSLFLSGPRQCCEEYFENVLMPQNECTQHDRQHRNMAVVLN